MDLTALQSELLGRLRSAVEGRPSRRVVYCTEWLGYLPFGQYQWVECDGHDISPTFPAEWRLDWSRTDLDALAEVGLLRKVDEWRNPDDECDMKVTYEIPSA